MRIKRVIDKNKLPTYLKSAGLTLDLQALSLTLADGQVVFPQSRDFKLLALLIETAPNVVSREAVMKLLFAENSSAEELPTQRTIDNSILRLRQILKNSGAENIRSVRGIGYQWLNTNNSGGK